MIGIQPHRLAVLALNGFVLFDLSIPFEIFSRAKLSDGNRAYEVFFAGPKTTARSGSAHVDNVRPLSSIFEADTLIVPGIESPLSFADQSVLAAIRRSAELGVRLASICTGACVLAASGVLDGQRATTHWEMAQAMAEKYPAVTVEPDVLFIDNGAILTSAGLASGIDLCLHLVRKDFGQRAASLSAEYFVVPLEREGGQVQLIRRGDVGPEDALSGLLAWMQDNLHRDLTLDELSGRVCMSPRTLNRKFQERTGAAPMAWLARQRIRRAQALLESTSMPVEQIARATGFGSASALRAAFKRRVGTSPLAWRKTYT